MCLVRVEMQGDDHLLITVSVSTTNGRGLYSVGRPNAQKRFADPGPALEEVARFLDAFSSPIVK
jgi:hypothetical protein